MPLSLAYSVNMEGLFINDDGLHHSAVLGHILQPTHNDPYRYQHGFGNHHASEAFAGALPRNGTNLPQKHPYGLYAEHLNGTPFISSRESVLNTYVYQTSTLKAAHSYPGGANMDVWDRWMYRVRPSVAHRPLRPHKISSEVR